MTRARFRYAVIALLLISFALDATVLLSAANEVNRIRGDFCSWALTHAQVLQSQSRTAAQTRDLESDRRLTGRLGC